MIALYMAGYVSLDPNSKDDLPQAQRARRSRDPWREEVCIDHEPLVPALAQALAGIQQVQATIMIAHGRGRELRTITGAISWKLADEAREDLCVDTQRVINDIEEEDGGYVEVWVVHPPVLPREAARLITHRPTLVANRPTTLRELVLQRQMPDLGD
jgi:hypothetical protein